ncbi:MAG: restriction endonuclease subunit S [Winogradskyella sp.]|uniref:restriction endonuclease subunit S n=1 Tax=Winogradskyella sp. TaxID=1883156 RepID=UPI00385F6716
MSEMLKTYEEALETKEGFKKTKIGWIPKDWEIKQIKDFAKVITGNTPPTKEPLNYGFDYSFVSPADLSSQKYVLKTGKMLSTKGFELSRKMPIGSVLFTCIGSTIGKTGINKEVLTSNQQINAILPSKYHDSEFIYYELNRLVPKIKLLAGEQAVPMINKSEFESNYIIFPPLPEQQKIASILSDWDKAVENTQTLIDKLQLRKKGLMQELLTGKTRLAGYRDEWQLIKAGDLFENHTDKNHDGTLEVLSATQDKGVIPRSETGIDIKYNPKSLKNYKRLDVGDFVISLRSFQGGIEYSNYEGLVSPAYTVLRDKLPISKLFYREYMKTQSFINILNSMIYGIRDGKQISYKEFSTMKILYPSVKEQKAIASVIEIADKEINQYQSYLEQLIAQKKGLMQQLLTGKIRVKV